MTDDNQSNQDNRQPLPVDNQEGRLINPPLDELIDRLWQETWAEMVARGIERMPSGEREMAQWIIKYHPAHTTRADFSLATHGLRLHQLGDTLPEPDITVKWEDIDG